MKRDRTILAYVDLVGSPTLVGTLHTSAPKGKETASFSYDSSWLDHPERFALDPALSLGPGPHHTDKALFGALCDSAPDRWGGSSCAARNAGLQALEVVTITDRHLDVQGNVR